MGRKEKRGILGGITVVGLAAWVMIITSATDKSSVETTETSAKPEPVEAYQVKSLALPETINFAGESVPIERFDIRERLDREMLSNTYFHSNTILMIKRANRYFPIIEPILKANNIPDDFKYVAMIESGFDPRTVSPAGAAGIWQFMKATGPEYGLEVNSYVDERYNVEKATQAACEFLQKQYDKFGSWAMTAAAYNAGRTRIIRTMDEQQNDNYFDLLLPEETKRYVFRALALKEIFKNPVAYGFRVSKEDLYPQMVYTELQINTPITNIVEFAKEHNTTYYMLKEFNPWLRDNYLRNASGKLYTIKIPVTEALNVDVNNIKVHNKNWVVNE